MISLGIDPGTRRIGYGVVEKIGPTTKLVEAGLLSILSSEDIPALLEAKREMDRIIEKFNPQIIGVEKLFFSNNQKTAMAVAQARGVILLSAEEHGIFIKEYTPNQAKSALTGYGSADKQAMLKMVRLILCQPNLKVIDDASDALAFAIIAADERQRS